MTSPSSSSSTSGASDAPEPALAAPLSPETPLARYLLASGHFSRENRRVKSAAFLPPPDGRLSVFRVDGLADPEIWSLGRARVAEPQGKPLYARADLPVRATREAGLDADPDDTPPRHVTILGWPAEKSARKLLAHQLAEAAVLHVAPTG